MATSVSGPASALGVPASRNVRAVGPGITSTTIYIGLGYSSQSAAGDLAIGAGGAAPSYDTRDVINAIIDYANKHGGFAGRTLKPLYYDFKINQDINTQAQAACAYWTQDHKVFALAGGNDILNSCAEKAGAISISAGAATAETFKRYPHLVDPDAISFDRLGQVTVRGLYQSHYFAGKLGLVTWDDPIYRNALSNGYLATLRSLHITPVQVAFISVPQQIGAIADMTAAVNGTITKFKDLGIDHVIIQDGPAGIWAGDGLTFEWMNLAKGQYYYPRYGGNGNNAPGLGANPPDEEDHELIVDQSDYDKRFDEGWQTNQARERCFEIQATAGFPVSSSNENDEGIAASYCDYIFFFQHVVNSLAVLSADAYVASAERVGTAFATAAIYGAKLFPGRHDGGDMVRTEEFLASCGCLKYLGPPEYVD